MRVRLTSFALLIALMSAFLIAPAGSAVAKQPTGGASPFANIPLTGVLEDAMLHIDEFDVDDGTVVAVGRVTSGSASVPFRTPVTIEQSDPAGISAAATCPILHLVLGPLDLNLLGLRIQLNQVVLDITAESGGGILGDLLCGIAGLLDNPTGLAALLNQILDLLDGILSTPATGTVTGALLDITSFSRQGSSFSATGTISDAAGNVLANAVTFPMTIADATCEILDLELGPLDLDLLGLVVHLDRVNLEITAEQGPGNLLGNLLCAIAGLLDGGAGGALNGIARLLNQILGILG